jgi:hypothetical protein
MEELVFRGAVCSLLLSAGFTPGQTMLVGPACFGVGELTRTRRACLLHSVPVPLLFVPLLYFRFMALVFP